MIFCSGFLTSFFRALILLLIVFVFFAFIVYRSNVIIPLLLVLNVLLLGNRRSETVPDRDRLEQVFVLWPRGPVAPPEFRMKKIPATICFFLLTCIPPFRIPRCRRLWVGVDWSEKKISFAVDKFTAYSAGPFQGIGDMSTCLYIGLKDLSTNGLFTSVLNWMIRTALKIQKQTKTKRHKKSNENKGSCLKLLSGFFSVWRGGTPPFR